MKSNLDYTNNNLINNNRDPIRDYDSQVRVENKKKFKTIGSTNISPEKNRF